jgi:hypothetical protein
MTDIYLLAADEAAAKAALGPLGFTDAGGAWRPAAPHFALDAPIPVTATPAVIAPDRTVVSEAVPAAGYHVNLRVLDADLAAAVLATGLAVTPTTPQRRFA